MADVIGRAIIQVVTQLDQASASGIGATLAATGKKLTAGLTVPLVAAGVAAAKVAGDFDRSMSVLQAATGATNRQIQTMTGLAEQLAPKMGVPIGQVADGMVALGKAGENAGQIMKTLPQVMALAATEGLNLGDAADDVVATLSQFNLPASKAATVVNALAGASNASTASVAGLAESLKLVGPAAHTVGANVQQTAGALAELAQGGLKGTQAGTSLGAVLGHLQPRTKAAADAMKDLGLKFTDAQGGFETMPQIVQQLQDKLGKLPAAARTADISRIFGNDQSVISAVNILVDQGAKGLDKYTKAASDMNAAHRLAAARMQGLAGSMDKLKSSLSVIGEQFGNAIAPAIQKVAGFVTDLTKKFSDLSPHTRTLVTVGGAIAAALGPALVAVGSVVSAVSAIAGAFAAVPLAPVIAIGAAVAGLAVGFVELWKNSDGFRDALIDAWNKIRAAVVPAVAQIKTMVTTQLVPALSGIWTAVQPAVVPMAKFFGGTFLSSVVLAVKGITNSITGIVQVITGVVTGVNDLIHGRWSKLWGDAKQVVSGFGNIIKGQFQLIVSNIERVFPPLKLVGPAFHAATGAAQTAAKAIGGGVSSAFRGVVASARTVVNYIGNKLAPVFRVLRQVTQTQIRAWETVISGGTKAAVAVFHGFVASVRAIAGAVRSAMGAIRGAFSTAFGGINDVISTAWGAIKGIFSKGIGALATVVSSGVGRVVNAWRRVGTGIKNALSGLTSEMVGIGKDVMAGFLRGIEAGAQAVLDKAKSIANSVKNTVTGALHIGSPSKVFHQIGLDIMAGWSNGLDSGGKAMLKTMDGLAKSLRTHGETGGAAVVTAFTKRLGDIPKAYDAVTKQVTQATAKLASLQKTVSDTASSIVDSFNLSQLDVSTVAPANAFSSIVAQFQSARDETKAWSAALAQLQRQGIRKDLFNEFVATGPSALGEVQAILAQKGVTQINSLQAQIVAFANQAGLTVAREVAPGGVAAATAFLTTLRKHQASLVAQFNAIADRFGQRLRRAVDRTTGGVTIRVAPSTGRAARTAIQAAPLEAATTLAAAVHTTRTARTPAQRAAPTVVRVAPQETRDLRPVNITQVFNGPSIGRDRVRELRWSLRYSPR